jgi:hypothetical protein
MDPGCPQVTRSECRFAPLPKGWLSEPSPAPPASFPPTTAAAAFPAFIACEHFIGNGAREWRQGDFNSLNQNRAHSLAPIPLPKGLFFEPSPPHPRPLRQRLRPPRIRLSSPASTSSEMGQENGGRGISILSIKNRAHSLASIPLPKGLLFEPSPPNPAASSPATAAAAIPAFIPCEHFIRIFRQGNGGRGISILSIKNRAHSLAPIPLPKGWLFEPQSLLKLVPHFSGSASPPSILKV